MRSAGLESITAKHISLTAQSLGLVMAIIPYIKTGVAQYLNPRQINLLNDFDKIIGDYRNHQNELYMHLVNIMMDRLHTHSQHLLVR
jgi:Vps54-like protein